MDDTKQQLADKLKSANNILVTVSRNPSVDQLSALLGLTLLLNKQGKHTAAVFSGQVPSTLEFLKPEDTIEKNTDSLRDFIIALDKNKADKLRYKVEDNVVRIFITPYKTSISESDFDFSQGDFNVDVVVALGVHQQEDLDEAITAHGRILHDATVASINASVDGSSVGVMSWNSAEASSLSEMITELVQMIDASALDEQIATALLTGIVAETDRFRNEKTTPATMSMSSALMTAGANQQLVASKLEETPVETTSVSEEGVTEHNGTIDIEHNAEPDAPETTDFELPTPEFSPEEPVDNGSVLTGGEPMITEPPATEPVLPIEQPDPLAGEQDGVTPPAFSPAPEPDPSTAPALDDTSTRTLTELEASVDSPHLDATTEAPAETTPEAPVPDAPIENLDAARDEVNRAISGAVDQTAPSTEPIQALNAQPLGEELHNEPIVNNDIPAQIDESKLPTDPGMPPSAPVITPTEPVTSDMPVTVSAPQVADPTAPPPVPPPIPFQFGNPPQSQ